MRDLVGLVGAGLCFLDTQVNYTTLVLLLAILGELCHWGLCCRQRARPTKALTAVAPKTEHAPKTTSERTTITITGARWFAWTWIRNQRQWGVIAGPARKACRNRIPRIREARGLGAAWRHSPLSLKDTQLDPSLCSEAHDSTLCGVCAEARDLL